MPEGRLERLFRNLRVVGAVDGRIRQGAEVTYRDGTLNIASPLAHPEGALVEVILARPQQAGAVAILGHVRRADGGVAIQPLVRVMPLKEAGSIAAGELPALPERLLAPEGLFKIIIGFKHLPALSAISAKALELSMRETTAAGDLAEVVKQDPLLSAEILRLANSPYYGLRRRVASVDRAVVVLGFNRVRAAVLTVSVLRMWPRGEANRRSLLPVEFAETRLWQHSLASAIASEALAAELAAYTPENAFVAGLFHDVGKMLLDLFLSPLMARVLLERRRAGCRMHEAELAVCGLGHERIGEWLADFWGLPAFIRRVIELHHLPELAGAAEHAAGLVHLGNVLAHVLGVGTLEDEAAPAPHGSTVRALGLGAGRWAGVVARFIKGLANSRVFFSMFGEGEVPQSVRMLFEAEEQPARRAELAAHIQKRLGDAGDLELRMLADTTCQVLLGEFRG